MPKAIILFSGGLDSTTCLAIAKNRGFDCYTISFDYGQKHSYELEAAKTIALAANVKDHKIIKLSLDQLTRSALTSKDIEVPDYKNSKEIPVTYVPARNTVFLALALGWAESIDASHIFLGINATDYSGYPDCRPEFLEAFQTLANLATKSGVEGQKFQIEAPLLLLSKAEIIKLGHSLGVDYSKTVTCYKVDDHGRACGTCDSCVLRKRGFEASGLADTTRYVHVIT